MVVSTGQMTLPNFLIIGAQRSGTTSLYGYLKQHPEIFMSPIKEPRFFIFEGGEPQFRGVHDRDASIARYQAIRKQSIVNFEEYSALFQGVTNQKAIGEASPHYLYSPRAVESIKKYLPHVKLIAILRDPVERAFSNHFLDAQQGNNFVSDFIQAFKKEDVSVNDGWSGYVHYVRKGFYHAQLMRYFSMFNQNQIRVYLYEDLKKDPRGLLQNIFSFLSVDDTFVPDISRKLSTSAARVRGNSSPYFFSTGKFPIMLFKSFLPGKIRHKIRAYIPVREESFVKPTLPQEIRKQLIEVYREDILKLQDLMQRDLSKWLEA